MDYPDNIIWPLGSSLSSVVLLAWLIWAFRKQKKYFASYIPGQTRWNDILSSVVCICSVGAGVDNLFSEGLFKQGFAGYLCSIAAWFYVALMAFLRSILTIDLGGNSN